MFDVQSPVNYEQKCLCVLLLDTSGSMHGNPISELQNGIEIFHHEISGDPTTTNRLEIAIITFDSKVNVLQNPSLVSDFIMPKLSANGATFMGEAIEEAISLVEARKSWYKLTGQPYYRPWIIVITDGEPTDVPNLFDLHKKIQEDVNNKKYFFYAIGVEDANMDKLKQISSEKMPPAKLQGLKFADFFKWLSASMTQVTSSADDSIINLPSPADWMEGFVIK
jgi:uncharacterized protein YegL